MNNEDNKRLVDPNIDRLLEEFNQSRCDLRKDLENVNKLKEKIETLFPSDINFRNKHVLEEKIKTLTSLLSTILNYRQEINKSISSEIEIRKKLISKDDDKGVVDIRAIAAKLEKMSAISNTIEFSSDISDKSEVDTLSDVSEM